MSERIGIMGRERMLADKLTKQLIERGCVGHETTNASATRFGTTFRVRLFDGPEFAGRVATVTVEMEPLP